MIGVFRIREDKISEMKKGSRYMVIKMFLTIYAIFIAAILLRKDVDKVESFIIVTGVLGVMFLLVIIISLFVNSPIYNTVIEVTDHGLVRTGHELLTVRIRFEEIGKIIAKDNGTILLKKGLAPRISLHLNKQAYINEFDILFIPLAIDNYESIIKYVKQRIK